MMAEAQSPTRHDTMSRFHYTVMTWNVSCRCLLGNIHRLSLFFILDTHCPNLVIDLSFTFTLPIRIPQPPPSQMTFMLMTWKMKKPIKARWKLLLSPTRKKRLLRFSWMVTKATMKMKVSPILPNAAMQTGQDGHPYHRGRARREKTERKSRLGAGAGNVLGTTPNDEEQGEISFDRSILEHSWNSVFSKACFV